MISDKELADAVVAMGVGYRLEPYAYGIFRAEGTSERIGPPANFITDWRVAGALMDKVHDLSKPFKWIDVMRDVRRIPLGDPLERAIIEACVEALKW